jgi:uncharacterized protein YjbJ (UPF0337 family)
MNWDRLEGEWKQRRGKAVHRWGRLMNDELAAIAGKYEELVGRMQERYGIAREESNRHFEDFKKVVGQLKKSNAKLLKLQARYKKATSAHGVARPKTSRLKMRGARADQPIAHRR